MSYKQSHSGFMGKCAYVCLYVNKWNHCMIVTLRIRLNCLVYSVRRKWCLLYPRVFCGFFFLNFLQFLLLEVCFTILFHNFFYNNAMQGRHVAFSILWRQSSVERHYITMRNFPFRKLSFNADMVPHLLTYWLSRKLGSNLSTRMNRTSNNFVERCWVSGSNVIELSVVFKPANFSWSAF